MLVTHRMRPLWVEGRTVHQVGLPYHWGYNGTVTGDVVNDLLVISEEPNVRIMETKALVCDIEPGPPRAWSGGAGAMETTSGAAGMSATTTAFLTDSTLVYWLQGLRGRLQGMERPFRGRPQLVWQFLRQHRRGGPLNLAPREVCGRQAGARLWWQLRDLTSWGFSSDVCKHCEVAGCLEACPTGAHRAHRIRRSLRAA